MVILAQAWTAPAQAQRSPPDAGPTQVPGERAPSAIDDELRQLEQQRGRTRVGLPITVTLIGATSLVLAPLIYEMSGLCALGHTEDSCESRDSVQSAAIAMGVGGFVVAGVGVIWWMHNHGARRELDTRIEELRRRRHATLAWSPYADHHRVGASLRLRW
jgi:hypothetical protein